MKRMVFSMLIRWGCNGVPWVQLDEMPEVLWSPMETQTIGEGRWYYGFQGIGAN